MSSTLASVRLPLYRITVFCLVLACLVPGAEIQSLAERPCEDAAQLTPVAETIVIDPSAPSHTFPHYWERMFGSGRAILSLRESYRRDLRAVKDATGFDYVRFHAILNDEVGVYDEDAQGNPIYIFPTWIRSMTVCSRTASAHSSS